MKKPATGLGVSEIAELLGVTRQAVHEASRREDFPAPIVKTRRGWFWDREAVIEWAKATRGWVPPLEERLSSLGELVDGLGS